jgi:hypothetical protein
MLSARTIYREIFDNDEAFGCSAPSPPAARRRAGGRTAKSRRWYPARRPAVPADTDYTMRLEAAGIGLAHARLRREEELTEADIVTYLAVEVTALIASLGSWMRGSGTSVTRTSRFTRHVSAFMSRSRPPWFRPCLPGIRASLPV